MQNFDRFCLLLLVAACSVLEFYPSVFGFFLRFLGMDYASILNLLSQGGGFGCGFVMFGRLSRVFNVLGVALILGFSVKVLHSVWHTKSSMHFLCELRGKPRNGFCMNGDCSEACKSKVSPCNESVPMRQVESPHFANKNSLVGEKEDFLISNHDVKGRDTVEGIDDGVRESCDYDEDQEFNVMVLRKMVKFERQRANAAYAELEKERMAASSAADEAMAMILRLQSEKSSIEIQANQYRRIAEQKQQYDQEVIQSLQWIVMRYKTDMSVMEEQLKLWRQKLKKYMIGDGVDLFDVAADRDASLLNSTLEDGYDSVLLSSHEPDSSD